MSNEIRTEIAALGEFGLIHHLTDNILLQNKTSIKGVGDDAAILSAPANEKCLVSTDMLVEGVHFDLSYVPLKHLGYKSVVVNLSDICAMNAVPHQIVVGLALSNRFSLEALDELYAGILMACNQYGVDLVGGDTTSSKSGLVISITAIGYEAEENIATRSGARENDLLVITGDIVKAGESIAFIGDSGENSEGPHLHFELWENGAPVNPAQYLSFGQESVISY